MKTIVHIVVLALICQQSFAQTIRRVSNLPLTNPGTLVYTTIQDAVTAASDNDIIYIEPSSTFYTSFTVSKKLNFIGNGNFLDQNPGTPFDKTLSKVNGVVSFIAGSSGSTIRGIYFDDQVAFINTDQIQIIGNRFRVTVYFNTNTQKHLFARNYVGGSLYAHSAATAGINMDIANNIIVGSTISYFKNSSIHNNSLSFNSTTLAMHDNTDCMIFNNIIDRRGFNAVRYLTDQNVGSTANNNLQIIAAGSALPAVNPDASANRYITDGTQVFAVAIPWTSNPARDSDFKLKTGSPAIGMGQFGVDAGAFGGPAPYTLSGLPKVPVITAVMSTGTATSTTPINVQVSVRSN